MHTPNDRYLDKLEGIFMDLNAVHGTDIAFIRWKHMDIHSFVYVYTGDLPFGLLERINKDFHSMLKKRLSRFKEHHKYTYFLVKG